MGDLTNDFSRVEFACKCGCGFDSIDLDLVKYLQKIRDKVHHRLDVTSGCRCAKHNAETSGSAATSSHLIGRAIDVRCETSAERFEFLMALFSLVDASEIEILQIELCKTWVHIGSDPSKGQYICYYG